MKKSGAPFLLGLKVLPGPFWDHFWTIFGLIFGPFLGSATRSVSAGEQDMRYCPNASRSSGRASACVSSVISKNVQKPMGFCTFLDTTLMQSVMTTLQGRALNLNQKCLPDGFKIDPKSVQNRVLKRVRFEIAFPIVLKPILDRIWADFGFQNFPKNFKKKAPRPSWEAQGLPRGLPSSIRDHFGTILGPFWDHSGTILGPFWDQVLIH